MTWRRKIIGLLAIFICGLSAVIGAVMIREPAETPTDAPVAITKEAESPCGSGVDDCPQKDEEAMEEWERELSLVDPCVYSNVPCWPETTRAQRERQIEEKIRNAANEAGVDPQVAIDIARCESSLDQYASNPTSSAKGLYQFLDGTWDYIGAVGHQFDIDESIKQFMIFYPIHPQWWKNCL